MLCPPAVRSGTVLRPFGLNATSKASSHAGPKKTCGRCPTELMALSLGCYTGCPRTQWRMWCCGATLGQCPPPGRLRLQGQPFSKSERSACWEKMWLGKINSPPLSLLLRDRSPHNDDHSLSRIGLGEELLPELNFSTFPKRSQADIFTMIHTWTMRPELLAFVGGQIGILRRGPSALRQVVPRYFEGAIVLFGGEFNTIPLLRENKIRSSNIFWVASMENFKSICCFPHLHHYMSVHKAR